MTLAFIVWQLRANSFDQFTKLNCGVWSIGPRYMKHSRLRHPENERIALRQTGQIVGPVVFRRNNDAIGR